MKKIVISLAGLLATVVFAPEASAIPAFARQTGMACQACHFQHFPLLNSFGRAFKASGFTMMGAQGKVEDERLSIPNVLNISALATAGYQNQANASATTGGSSSYFTPNGGGELSLFFGGRISENIGFLSELAFPDGTPNTSAAKIPMLWDVGNNTRVGLVAVANQAPAYSLELLNTGAHSAHRLMGNRGPGDEHIRAYSAHQYLGIEGTKGHGFSLVAVNPNMGFVNIGKYAIGAVAAIASPSNTMNSTYARGVFMFNAGGWDSAVGIQSFSGQDNLTVGATDTKATIVDGQMQGEAGGMPVGVYASYGTAPANALTANLYNPFSGVVAGAQSARSFNIAGELGVIPNQATVQLAYRSARNGDVGTQDGDNAVMIGGTYKLAQNVELSLTHTSQSGSSWNNVVGCAIGSAMAAGANPFNCGQIGKTATTLLLEALF